MAPAVLAFVLALDTVDRLVGIGKYDAYIPSLVSSRLVKVAGGCRTGRGVPGSLSLWVFGWFLGSLRSMLCAFGLVRMEDARCGCWALRVRWHTHSHNMFWSRDVLVFPSTGAHRWHRWRTRAGSIVQRILPASIVSCGWYAGLVWVVGSWVHSGGQPGLGSVICVMSYTTMLLVLWSFGDSMADIVMTERPRLGDYGSKKVLAAMEECLNGVGAI